MTTSLSRSVPVVQDTSLYYDSLPDTLRDFTGNSVQLPLDDLLGLVCLPLLQTLANTSNDSKSSSDGSLDLVSNEFVGIAKHASSLRVTENDPVHIGIFKLVGGDFTREGTGGLGEAVLSGNL